VFSVEPLPVDHPFRMLENVVATPHLGYVSQQRYELFYGDGVRVIAA
jgi:phosphoglycerate dehydrogenase-like enzyme